MELGNMFFGHSHGEFPIDRDIFQEVFLKEFADKIGCNAYGYFNNGEDYGYENDVFKVMPYDWDAECTCGYDDLEFEWWNNHKHSDDCYQSLVEKELVKQGYKIEEDGYIDAPWEAKEKVWKKLCNQLGLSYPDGCAVHCTCGVDNEFSKWCENNYHKEDCRLLQPNFWYKPTNLKIMWYKYALRDAYANQDISIDEFRKILKHCVKSYKTLDKI